MVFIRRLPHQCKVALWVYFKWGQMEAAAHNDDGYLRRDRQDIVVTFYELRRQRNR